VSVKRTFTLQTAPTIQTCFDTWRATNVAYLLTDSCLS